jgi:hypothetical protein
MQERLRSRAFVNPSQLNERTCGMKWIRIALFSDRTEPGPIRQRLEQAGIPVNVHEGLGLARFWFISKAKASVRLEVSAEQEERARQLLFAWGASDRAPRHAIRCPECASLRVDFPQPHPAWAKPASHPV